jgi:hypothetical protein
MALTTTVKRAPRWAWYIAGGVGLGAIGIEVYKRRAVDTPAPGDASSGADVIGTPTGSAAPSPVITPPVIVQQPVPTSRAYSDRSVTSSQPAWRQSAHSPRATRG